MSGKEAASDAPSWAKIQPRGQNESAAEYATRLMDNKYGRGKWESDPSKGKGPSSEYSKIKKYGQRSFIEWLLSVTPKEEII
ncbi:hypothetical protein [Roseomonas gilardii]|uniref:hypothetical protein n=1 Tax=Roseomonas gilardii TaxID=257708 RepID=UPI0011C04FC6|nr:hypothetical protein [Roseomonas gilardii]